MIPLTRVSLRARLAAVSIAHYRPDPLVLVALGSLALALITALDLPPLIRVPAGLVGTFALPGYALGVALLPSPTLDLVERWVLSASLSIAVVIIGAPLLEAAGLGIRPTSLVMLLTGVTLVGAAIGYRRRSTTLAKERHARAGASNRAWSPGAAATSRPDPRRLAWGLAVALLAALAITVSARPSDYTEFFVLGTEGFADSYPTEIEAGSRVSIQVGITNREGETVAYRIAARSSSSDLAHLEPISVDADDTWTGPVGFSLAFPGPDQEVWIDLFVPGRADPYRSLRLWIDVLDGG